VSDGGDVVDYMDKTLNGSDHESGVSVDFVQLVNNVPYDCTLPETRSSLPTARIRSQPTRTMVLIGARQQHTPITRRQLTPTIRGTD
jgi:hypothetical protein